MPEQELFSIPNTVEGFIGKLVLFAMLWIIAKWIWSKLDKM